MTLDFAHGKVEPCRWYWPYTNKGGLARGPLPQEKSDQGDQVITIMESQGVGDGPKGREEEQEQEQEQNTEGYREGGDGVGREEGQLTEMVEHVRIKVRC